MNMPRVLVLCGGISDERAVSLRSGVAVTTALQAAGYEVIEADPANMSSVDKALSQANVVFPVLHGKGGEDGVIQRVLEKRGIPYVGADSSVSAFCFDKWRYKQKMIEDGIRIPRGLLVDHDTCWSSELSAQPFVLKPFDGGSSVDTFIIRDPVTFDRTSVDAAFTRHPQMLLEQLIEGTELTVGVLIDFALPVIEIVPPVGAEFDYENKYNGTTQELCPPQTVSKELQSQAQALAQRIHTLLGVRDLSRTDIMIGANDALYVLETNTLPGMTGQSLFPKAAAVAGYPMTELVRTLVESALERRNGSR